MKSQGDKRKSSRRHIGLLCIAVAIGVIPVSRSAYASEGEDSIIRSLDGTVIAVNLMRENLHACQDRVVYMEGIELQAAPLIFSFYEQNGYELVWANESGITLQAEHFISLFKNAGELGFDPANFDVRELDRYRHILSKERNSNKAAKFMVKFELLMTNSAFSLMLHLTQGPVLANRKNVFINGDPLVLAFPGHLQRILDKVDIAAEIMKIGPGGQMVGDQMKQGINSRYLRYIQLINEMDMVRWGFKAEDILYTTVQ